MKNKNRNTIIYMLFFVIIFLSVMLLINYKLYKRLNYNYNSKLNMILNDIDSKYGLDEEDIISILNSNDSKYNDLLKSYGIDINEDSVILDNDRIYSLYIVIMFIVIIMFVLVISVIFIKYNYYKDKKIKEITKYVEEINKKNYKLYIDDNSDDELSILKNEICKTTIMLRELADNSLKDKLSIKESLEDISHQLKTPLTSINIMLDNIIDDVDMDEMVRRDFINNIKREVTNINSLVLSLLKLTKFDVNVVKFMSNIVYVNKIVKDAIRNVLVIADSKNIKFNINGDDDIKLVCDYKWEVEAISNILKNSIEHSNSNGVIDISYSQNKVYTLICIKDYGVGIDSKDIKHIFERFYKGKNSSRDSIGIGLALSKNIIEKDNGSISVNSKKTLGTVFQIKYYR